MGEQNTQELLDEAIREGIRDGIKAKLSSGYSSPLSKAIDSAIESHGGGLRQLLEESIASCLSDDEFRQSVATETRRIMARQLIQKFGGELEKQVNALKSEPITRARIVMAIEEIVKTTL